MRHPILDSLHQDHINMSKVAALVAAELVEIEDGGKADLELLEDIMSYVTVYPDTHHHPTEDIVFAHLQQVAPEADAAVRDLLAEHADLIDIELDVLSDARVFDILQTKIFSTDFNRFSLRI